MAFANENQVAAAHTIFQQEDVAAEIIKFSLQRNYSNFWCVRKSQTRFKIQCMYRRDDSNTNDAGDRCDMMSLMT